MAAEWTPIHERDPLLHQAAYVGDLNKLTSLLKDKKHRQFLNTKNRLGCSPIRLAATVGHADCVACLIEQGVDVNIIDVKAQTPLFVAVKNKHLDCMRLLLQAGANPNGDLHSLCTPLYIAAMDGFLQGVQELVLYGADIDRSQISLGSFISNPLYITIAYHHLDCFKALLRAGADVDYNPRTMASRCHLPSCQSLYHAVVKHNVEVDYVRLLDDYGASLYYKDEKGRLAWQLDKKNECQDYLLESHSCPRMLMSQCRIFIRAVLGRERLSAIDTLPLPPKLKQYLDHQI